MLYFVAIMNDKQTQMEGKVERFDLMELYKPCLILYWKHLYLRHWIRNLKKLGANIINFLQSNSFDPDFVT